MHSNNLTISQSTISQHVGDLETLRSQIDAVTSDLETLEATQATLLDALDALRVNGLTTPDIAESVLGSIQRVLGIVSARSRLQGDLIKVKKLWDHGSGIDSVLSQVSKSLDARVINEATLDDKRDLF